MLTSAIHNFELIPHIGSVTKPSPHFEALLQHLEYNEHLDGI